MGQYKTYIWYGKGCDAEERFTAKILSEKLDRGMLVGASPLEGKIPVVSVRSKTSGF